MKFTAAASILFAFANGADAFVVPGTSRTASISALRAGPSADPYESMLVAITNSADAASTAAKTSSDLASSLSSNSFDIASTIMTPEAISAAQAKLSILESNVATSSDPAVMSKAIIDALDMSIQAAEHAVDSTSILTANLANFDTVLSNSMAMHSFHLLPPETAEVAQANMAALLHNLGGLSMDDSFLTNFIADVDRKIDTLTAGANVNTGTLLMYGALAVALGYSQREVGVKGYKAELRQMIAEGELDMDMLAKDVGLQVEMVKYADKHDVQVEDPSIAMAAIEEKEGKNKVEKERAEALLTVQVLTEKPKPTSAQQSFFAPVYKKPEPTLAQQTFFAPVAPKPPVEDVPINTLMEAVASEDNPQKAPVVEPEKVAVVAEMTIKKRPSKVNVVVQKKNKKIVKPKGPAASPLARLRAGELGLDLNNLGKGSGKNGKILIDDVRKFHARMEDAKNSITAGRAYFATASA